MTQQDPCRPGDYQASDARDKEADFRAALASCREIGAAIGILMERYKLTYDDAWQRLRQASQPRNTPVRHVASDLVHSGQWSDDLP